MNDVMCFNSTNTLTLRIKCTTCWISCILFACVGIHKLFSMRSGRLVLLIDETLNFCEMTHVLCCNAEVFVLWYDCVNVPAVMLVQMKTSEVQPSGADEKRAKTKLHFPSHELMRMSGASKPS